MYFRIESFNKVGFVVVVKMDGFIVDYMLLNLVFIEDNNLKLSY